MKSNLLVALAFLAITIGFSLPAMADDLKLSDIISGDGSVSATSGGKTTTVSGNASSGNLTTAKTSSQSSTNQTAENTAGSSLRISDIISGDGSVSATGGGKTTTVSGDPSKGKLSETKTSNQPGQDGQTSSDLPKIVNTSIGRNATGINSNSSFVLPYSESMDKTAADVKPSNQDQSKGESGVTDELWKDSINSGPDQTSLEAPSEKDLKDSEPKPAPLGGSLYPVPFQSDVEDPFGFTPGNKALPASPEFTDQGRGFITQDEYLNGLFRLNEEVAIGKITEAQWEEQTEALRKQFLAGEKQQSKGPDQTSLEAPPGETHDPTTSVTWNEYMSGVDALNKEVEDGKITEAQWNEKTQALRGRFLKGEKERRKNSPSFGDNIGPGGVDPNRFGGSALGTEIFNTPGGPGAFGTSNDALLNDPVFFAQRFDELYGTAPVSDPNELPN